VFVDRIAAAPENETLMLDWNRERKSEDSWKDNIEITPSFAVDVSKIPSCQLWLLY
jgi:hypothetical protein